MTLEAYELERRIGSGAAGTVWRARRKGPVPQVVALKRLRAGTDDADLDRLRREALVLAAVDHPHIVRIVEVLEDGDGIALAMQFAPGGSLETLLAERGRLSAGETVAVTAPIADALASAHRRNVVHGDVKPANILFTSDGEPLLTDFGVARTLGRLTSDQVAGTATYLAPELLDGAQPDARTDVYSLGVLAYELLAGAPPYDAGTPLAIVHAAATGEHRSLHDVEGVPTALVDVVERAIVGDPAERFESAAALASALRDAVPQSELRLPGIATRPDASGGDVSGTRTFGPRPPRKEPRPRRQHRWRLPVLAGVAALTIGAVFVLRDDDAGDCPAFEPTVSTVSGDPEGDGIPTDATFQIEQGAGPGCALYGRLYITIAGEERTFRIGEPGDQLLLGDWGPDCDGIDTPAVYRPETGELAFHDEWPASGQSPAEPRVEQVQADGEAVLVPGDGATACDTVVVEAS